MQYYVKSTELYHYGVPGMKWGVRKDKKLLSKADAASARATEYSERAKTAAAKGKMRKASKYIQKVEEYNRIADKNRQKVHKRIEKKYENVGYDEGKASYYKDKAKAAYAEYDKKAKLIERMAAAHDREGQFVKGETLRMTAEKLRASGANIRDEHLKTAQDYINSSVKLDKKLSEYASTINTKVGKAKVESILSAARKKGYDRAKAIDEWIEEEKREERANNRAESAIRDDADAIRNRIRVSFN